ncbi:putative 2-deoxyglucose-6-phosphate phosphatase [Nemania sp. FL0916]|nr:putative 2-deoxyglucose-6-phosphate phosphatase [Nemania sp. FL0916]
MSASQDNPNPDWRPKALVFDLLTALIDSWSLWDASTPSGTAAEGRRWRERYLEITFNTGAYVPYEDLVKQAAQEVGLPPSAPEALLSNWKNLQPWPEVATVLPALKARGYLLGVVTNCSVHLGDLAVGRVEDLVSTEVGNEFSFDASITAEEMGVYKPAKEAYLSILTGLNVEVEDVLFVAGSAGDVQGATDAGMKVVWHNRVGLAKKGEAVPLKEAKSLNDLLKDLL